MTTDALIVDLFSHATNEKGHINLASNFINTFPEDIDFSLYEMGVKQISIPATWYRPQHAAYLHWIVVSILPFTAKYSAKNIEFPHYAQVILDDHVQWVGEGHRCLFFTLKPGLYNITQDILDQMLAQTNAAFVAYLDHQKISSLREKSYPQDPPTLISKT